MQGLFPSQMWSRLLLVLLQAATDLQGFQAFHWYDPVIALAIDSSILRLPN